MGHSHTAPAQTLWRILLRLQTNTFYRPPHWNPPRYKMAFLTAGCGSGNRMDGSVACPYTTQSPQKSQWSKPIVIENISSQYKTFWHFFLLKCANVCYIIKIHRSECACWSEIMNWIIEQHEINYYNSRTKYTCIHVMFRSDKTLQTFRTFNHLDKQ